MTPRPGNGLLSHLVLCQTGRRMEPVRPEQTFQILKRDFARASERLHLLSGSHLHDESPQREDACLFNLERVAHIVLQLADFWILQTRIGVPKGGHSSLDTLTKNDKIAIDFARRLRYIAEYRNLSARESERVDLSVTRHDLSEELALVSRFFELAEKDVKAWV